MQTSFRPLFLQACAVLLAACLAAGTLSTKAAGAFWLGLSLAGLLALCVAGVHRPAVKGDSNLLRELAGWWLAACVLALALKAIPMFYWSGPWEERHAEFRLLIGAIGLWWLARYARVTSAPMVLLGHALALACVLSLALVLVKTSDAAPTNRIPWAAGVSLLSCTLLYWSYAGTFGRAWTALWRFASFLAFTAVMFSGVRGSYLLILLWPLLFVCLHMQREKVTAVPSKGWHWLLVPAALGLMVWTAMKLPGGYSPVQRIQQAISEGIVQDVNTSNGARLAMWGAASEAIADNPLLGSGYSGGKGLLKQTAQKRQSHEIARLGHFHNDYLHTAVEFGLLGLASYLSFGAGLLAMVVVCWRRRAPLPAIGLSGLLVMHASTGLTNVNFAHNYYPTILSISVTLVLLSCALHRAPEPLR